MRWEDGACFSFSISFELRLDRADLPFKILEQRLAAGGMSLRSGGVRLK